MKDLSKEFKKLGFKEYKPSPYEDADKAWQKKLSEETCVNIYWVNTNDKLRFPVPIPPYKVEIYHSLGDGAVQIKIYGWRDWKKAWGVVKKFIEVI